MSSQILDEQQRSSAERHSAVYPEQSRATAVFVLGVLGLCVFPPLAPFAWVMGTREIAAIDAGRRPPDHRQLAHIGRRLGIVVTSLWTLFIVLVGTFFALDFAVLRQVEDSIT